MTCDRYLSNSNSPIVPPGIDSAGFQRQITLIRYASTQAWILTDAVIASHGSEPQLDAFARFAHNLHPFMVYPLAPTLSDIDFMRISKITAIAFICLFLSACVSSMLIGNKLQSKLMWSFLKPLVGFDPNEVNLFEAPIIKDRMTALLGDKYEPTMKLLRTAQEIQQEGALFYVASRFAPAQVQAITDKAGMVWNADTNQMAVMVIKDGVPEIFSEQIEGAKEKITPVLPKELQTAYDKAHAVKEILDEKQKALEKAQDIMENPIEATTEAVRKKVDSSIQEQKDAVQQQVDEKIQEATPLIDQDQLDLEEALKKEAESGEN